MDAKFLLTLIVSLAVSFPLSAQSGEETWVYLGETQGEELTGESVTISHYARRASPTVYVVRSDYPTDRYTVDRQRWRTKYLTTLIDCEHQWFTLIRTDYYSSRGEFVTSANMEGINGPAQRLPKGSSWEWVYDFACGESTNGTGR